MTSPITSPQAKALGNAIAGMLQGPTKVAAALAGTLVQRASSCGCEIPPPCWEPQPAGTCSLDLSPGGTATLRVHVSNCGWTRQVVAITALGKMAGWMSFSPTSLILDPMERMTMLVTIHVPDNVTMGYRFSAPIIIRGCRDHFIRLEIAISDCSGANCCDITVNDCADNVHHWYDHFYCARPCRTSRDTTGGGVKDG
jgi:hypothetical protein